MVKGYKVFNKDWTCRGKQYSCPGIFEEDGELAVCKHGMHFCKVAADCFGYYKFDPEIFREITGIRLRINEQVSK